MGILRAASPFAADDDEDEVDDEKNLGPDRLKRIGVFSDLHLSR